MRPCIKEYVNDAAAPMADAEVEAYLRLYATPDDSSQRNGNLRNLPFDPASIPVVPLVAYFASQPVGTGSGGGAVKRGSLWTVQAWGPGGLARLADYPSRRGLTLIMFSLSLCFQCNFSITSA